MNLSKSIIADTVALLEYAKWASKTLTMNAKEEKELPKNFGKKSTGKEGCFIVSDLFPKTFWNQISLKDKLTLGQLFFEETNRSLKNIIVAKQDDNGALLKSSQRQQIYQRV